MPTPEFMQELRAIADEIGACSIIDEIQAGMGRTGKWFCHEHYGVKPDIVTIAKGIASGYPLAAIAARKELWDKCLPGSMGGTYGGNAVACAAGVATIDAMARRRHARQRRQAGREAHEVLHRQAGRVPGHRRGARQGPHVRHRVRQAGHQGAQCGRRQGVHRRGCIKRNLILMGAGSFGNCVRFLPPLNITDADMDVALGIFDEAAKVAFA